jgi:adenosylmethionine-8-amino-7-oxononanoate aminotransferase
VPTAPAAASSAQDALDAADRRFGWHPFTQMREYQNNPRLHLVRGEGSWLIDGEGQRYLDGNASVWTNVHGHNDPDLNRALREPKISRASRTAPCRAVSTPTMVATPWKSP